MGTCNHSQMYFERGRLHCTQCGADRTPLDNTRTIVVFDDYREKKLHELEIIVNGLPESELKEILLYADYLKVKHGR